MSRKGDCWDNAPMERFFGSLKNELENDGRSEPPSREDSPARLHRGFDIQRSDLHSAIGYVTPNSQKTTRPPPRRP